MAVVRVLFLADTHLGFDLPFKPRIQRRRRGPDFFDSFRKALQPAFDGRVDCVVHGGDLLYRSRVPAELVVMALQPLKDVADTGIPVFLVPGNHERSEIPFGLLTKHRRLHVFDKPRTFSLQLGPMSIALAGFPFVRNSVGERFGALVAQTRWKEYSADASFLCVHQAFEGATVGPVGYTFRRGPDVVALQRIPQGFQAVLSGHIHRAQVLTEDLSGNVSAAPVLYPGSTERTSFAERDEQKGYLTLRIDQNRQTPKGRLTWNFHALPTRPMKLVEIPAGGMNGTELAAHLSSEIRKLPSDAIVKIRVHGLEEQAKSALRASSIRQLAPETLNLSVTVVE